MKPKHVATLALLALVTVALWKHSPSPKEVPVEKDELTHEQLDEAILIDEKVAVEQREFERLQDLHIESLNPDEPFIVEYTYGLNDLTEQEIAQHEAERIKESRWEQLRDFNDGALPHLNEEDRKITIELMNSEGLESLHEQ